MTGTLVPRYTFGTFTLGPHYRFAHAAAVAVAEAPGTACNPLFIYGGLRLGRTHLLHAIGNYAQELHPSLDIRYVRAAEFGRQFAIAAGDGRQDNLRSRYLDAGMLLVDEVQLLPGAEAIKAEFLHVFTTLHNGGRQLVISADRAPRLLAAWTTASATGLSGAWSANWRTIQTARPDSRLLTVAPARTAISPQPPGPRSANLAHTDPATHRPGTSPSRPAELGDMSAHARHG